MKRTTTFTWGYYGWGNHTPELVKIVDAVEASRGFKPPVFVDIRIRRSVRAVGFTGPAFERLLGNDRHRWMNSLGNKFIVTRKGPKIQIVDPTTANDLLDLALESARDNQRILFFCSCQWPRCDGEVHCHRATVAELVLAAAKKRRAPIEIVEWPGGEPEQIDLDVTPHVFGSISKGRTTVPLGEKPDLAEVGALPWGSIATLQSKGQELHQVVGPAIRQPDQWVMPILSVASANTLAQYRREAARLRRNLGLEPTTA